MMQEIFAPMILQVDVLFESLGITGEPEKVPILENS